MTVAYEWKIISRERTSHSESVSKITTPLRDSKVKKNLIRDAVGGERDEIKTMMVGEVKLTALHEAGFLQ